MHAVRIRQHANMRTEQTANTQAEYDGMITFMSTEEDMNPYLVAYFCQADTFPEISGKRPGIDNILNSRMGTANRDLSFASPSLAPVVCVEAILDEK